MALTAYHLLLGFLILHFQAFPLRNPLQIVQASPLCTQSLHAAKPSARTICGSRNFDVNPSVDVIGFEICSLAHDHVKEKIYCHLKLQQYCGK
ncbi:uncharacterized protein LOC131298373 isoform X2 [Rhododendron vialii]|uniref:uncharacterized protein LOC131298373 isoform X2 n=1 Tax=Rhododendron vialii TaxID=182163 RepID=UPI00265D8567|nr:uncharacterized protein LOC131298373 isoform X2 [Rhododendron vialii]